MRRLTSVFGAFTMLFSLLILIQPGPAAASPDVPVGLGGNEPHTAVVNPLNPQNVVVSQGSRLRISTDFGATFPVQANATTPPPVGDVASYSACGDSSLAFDSQGRLFWSYLYCGYDNAMPDPNRVDISIFVQQVNPTTGALIGSAIDLTPGDHSDDKAWIAADANPTSPFHDNLYVVWTRLGGSQIMFVRSTNQNVSWSAPQAVSAGGEGFVWPPHVNVAPNGDIYVAYHANTCDNTTGPVYVLRDSSGGVNLSNGTAVQKSSFQAAVTCNVQTDPGTIAGTQFWMQGAAQSYVLPDPNRPGNIYVVANDDPEDDFTTGDPGDVVLARSTDYGNNWSVSTVSHAPFGTLQVFPTGAIDQSGNLIVMWYDTRNGATNSSGHFLLDIYASVSRDGGLSFSNDFRVSDQSFDPDAGAPCRFECDPGDAGPQTLRIGEYNGIAAADGVAYLAFTGNSFSGATPVGQRILFDVVSITGVFPDRFEPNNAIQPGVATDLGVAASYSEPGLTIHSDTDEDFFKVTALATGKMTFQIGLNGRVADLDIEARDKNNVVAGSSGNPLSPDTNNIEQVVIPVVAGQPYYLRVFDRPGQIPPFNTYNLSIVNTPAPAPFGLALTTASDSGRNQSDRVTNVANPTIQLRVDSGPLTGLVFSPGSNPATDTPGYKIAVFDNGNLVGYATPDGSPGMFSFTFPGGTPLTEGANFLTARVVITDPLSGGVHEVGQGSESDSLLVTLDTLAPATAAAPDLLASSDTGGINVDNVTTITTPTFAGTAEPNSLVRVYADHGVGPALVGQGFASAGLGHYQITVGALADAVYNITVTQEDLAGNVSDASPALNVTIANQMLYLPGGTANPASSEITVDLAAGTVTGYTGIAGTGNVVGIQGIPVVSLDLNGNALSIDGTTTDDSLAFTPTGPNSGIVTRGGSAQVIAFTNAGDTFAIDPLSGNDTVSVVGTASDDTVTAVVDVTSTVQVGTWQTVSVPTANVEKLAITTGQGVDTVDVTAFDTVNAYLLVDGGDPTSIKKYSDVLNVQAGSEHPQIQNAPGGPVPDSGTVFVNYSHGTNNSTRIDYVNVEKVTKSH